MNSVVMENGAEMIIVIARMRWRSGWQMYFKLRQNDQRFASTHKAAWTVIKDLTEALHDGQAKKTEGATWHT